MLREKDDVMCWCVCVCVCMSVCASPKLATERKSLGVSSVTHRHITNTHTHTTGRRAEHSLPVPISHSVNNASSAMGNNQRDLYCHDRSCLDPTTFRCFNSDLFVQIKRVNEGAHVQRCWKVFERPTSPSSSLSLSTRSNY